MTPQFEMPDSALPLSLSAKGLQRLEAVHHERDFAFIVGDERYNCPSFVAEFLSPRIYSLRSQDITIQEFSIEAKDPGHYFGNLVSIGFGHNVSFSGDALSFVRSVCGELWNHELFEKTLKRDDGKMREDELRARLQFLGGVDGSFVCETGVIASHFYEFSPSDFDQLSSSVLESILRDPALVVQDEDSLFDIVHHLASEDLSYFGLLEFVRFEFLSTDCMERAFEFISSRFESFTFGLWSRFQARLTLSVTSPSAQDRFYVPAIDSKIISRIPEIFSVFEQKTFRLLYRGSHDGFRAKAFHDRCDGHANTVTLILSRNHCVFGGYTPVAWSSRGGHAPDPSLTSFIFTIKNPHNLPARIFKQKEEACAIFDHSSYGPGFGNGCDCIAYDDCDSSTGSYSNLGSAYVNDTGIAGDQVLVGARRFTVDEIEVFEVS